LQGVSDLIALIEAEKPTARATVYVLTTSSTKTAVHVINVTVNER